MIKSKLAIGIDSISISILIFITLFCLFRRYIKSAILLLFCCIFISFLLFIAIFKLFIKQYNLKNINSKELKHLNLCMNFFKFSSQKDFSNFFEKLLNAKHLKSVFFKNEHYIYYINLRHQLSSINFYDILDFYHSSNSKNIMVICDKYDNEFKTLVEQNNNLFSIFNTADLYKLMKEKGIFPKQLETSISYKQKIKSKFSTFIATLSKQHFKNYLFSGLSLIILSFFIPYSIYYSIFGSALLVLSIICLFNSKLNLSKPIKSSITLSDSIKK